MVIYELLAKGIQTLVKLETGADIELAPSFLHLVNRHGDKMGICIGGIEKDSVLLEQLDNEDCKWLFIYLPDLTEKDNLILISEKDFVSLKNKHKELWIKKKWSGQIQLRQLHKWLMKSMKESSS